jgi:redox-sensitive bicupin YhaK (pirin superfamily)
MLSTVLARQIYLGDYGWHVGRFHFSFADYDDPGNACFGDLITFNDFTLQPCSGFEKHPHQEIEIVSYCLNGELVHEDDMGNSETIKRGEMQYTCAGAGIFHSERNASQDKPLRFVQIWIRPNAAGLSPVYKAAHFKRSDRLNKFLHIVSGQSKKNVIRINQDANIFISEMMAGRQLSTRQLPGRQMYLACLEGSLNINYLSLEGGDAIKVWDEPFLTLTAMEDCHLVMVEMPRILQ